MLHVHEVRAGISLSAAELRAAVRTISRDGWVPAGTSSEAHFADLSGIPLESGSIFNAPRSRARMTSAEAWADVFFTRDSLFFVANRVAARGSSFDFGEFDEAIAVGGIGKDVEVLRAGVAELCGLIQAGVTSSLDGRRTRHMRFDWAAPQLHEPFVELFRYLELQGGQPRFTVPELDDTHIEGARLLSERGARLLLRELAEARFGRTQDILDRRGDQRKSIEETLRRLADRGLITSEYTLQCRGTSTFLTKLSGPERLEDPAVGELRCANCSRSFADENLVEGYAITELGEKLQRGSHWMTVWVTMGLTAAGAPVETIRWNLEESGEEVDILLDFLGQIWVLELKDREFGAGDAYPLNYRRARYRASQSLVITTEKVSVDARRVFSDLANGLRDRRGQTVSFIEGPEALEPSLTELFRTAALERAAVRASAVPLPIPVDLPTLVTSKFSES